MVSGFIYRSAHLRNAVQLIAVDDERRPGMDRQSGAINRKCGIADRIGHIIINVKRSRMDPTVRPLGL